MISRVKDYTRTSPVHMRSHEHGPLELIETLKLEPEGRKGQAAKLIGNETDHKDQRLIRQPAYLSALGRVPIPTRSAYSIQFTWTQFQPEPNSIDHGAHTIRTRSNKPETHMASGDLGPNVQ